MSETLHPKYLLTFDGNVQAINAGTFGPGYTYGIIFLPSGLVLFVNAYNTTQTPYYDPSNNSLMGVENYERIYWASPVPKTYEFFKNDGSIAFKINISDWQEPTASTPFFTCNCTAVRYGSSSYYLGVNGHYDTGLISRLLFINPILWNYRDSKTIAAQTTEDVELYPIYKDNQGNYQINSTSLQPGEYNFLTSYGALYQYDAENKLYEKYITIESVDGSKDIKNESSKKMDIKKDSVLPIADSKIHYRYGAIKDQAILLYQGSNNADTSYLDDNGNTPLLNVFDNNCCIYKSNAIPRVHWLDQYHLWIGNKNEVYRIPMGYTVGVLSFTPTSLTSRPGYISARYEERNDVWPGTNEFEPSFILDNGSIKTYLAYGSWQRIDGTTGKTQSGSGPKTKEWKLEVNYSFTTQILNKNNKLINDEYNRWWQKASWTLTNTYNISAAGNHIESGNYHSISSGYGWGLGFHDVNIPLIFTFNPRNFAIPLYNKNYKTNLPITFTSETFTDTYTSEYEYGWSNRYQYTNMMTIINYYYKKNSPTKVWFGLELHTKETQHLLPAFTYDLIKGSKTVTLKDDQGNNINVTVNAAKVSNNLVAAASASIDSPTTKTTYFICVAKI